MSKFVLTAQLQLKAPTNTKQVVSQMKRQLSGVNVSLNVKGAPQAQKQLAKINQQCKNVNKTGQRMGKTFGLALNRFAAFTVATRAVSLFTNGLANATKEAIAFERELVKISQVTGKTLKELSGLTNTITNLSVGLGTSSKDLLATTRILAQAGIQARDLDVALTSLAKTTLAPTFEDITKTAEGAVAILAQFGQGVGALEQQLGAINAVAGQFAVESGDLISVVRRTGGVFKAAGGDLNELLALFTSVRATTRESAESIATGLRTIFTRIQRPKTIEFLKQFGVQLTDLNGKFVGPYEAVRQLSDALAGLGEGDIRFVQIAEELGGFRQIGKVIPLLQQFETAERARQAALEGGGSLTKDAATAQQALAVQITKVKEEFLALVRSVSQTGSFQALVKTTLDLASALISVADALKPIIPLLTLFAGIKMAKGIAGFGRGLGGALKGGPQGFASGGIVPGTGNRDTVPAMLTPGEFVIRKSSVSKLGAGTLAQMNSNKFSNGGQAKATELTSGFNQSRVLRKKTKVEGNVKDKSVQFNEGDTLKSNIDEKFYPNKIPKGFKGEGQQVSPTQFERYVSLKLTESVANANQGNKAIDIINDIDMPTEVKRTKGKVSSGTLIDKLIRSFSTQGIKNSGYQSQLTGSQKDSLQLRPMRVAYPNGATMLAKEAAQIGVKKKKEKGIKQSKRNFFGGDIQKFALGGIATANRVGFGILDPDRKQADAKVPVTRAQVKAAIAAPPYSGNKSQQRGLDKEMASSSKNYNLTRQGLNKKTSDNFYNVITEEAAKGVGVAAQRLSQDLSLGSVTPDPNSMKVMQGIIRKSGSEMGGLFERTVNLMDNRGKFSPQAPGAPFDEPGGIKGALRDNYDKLPSSWVDLKTSYREASVPNMTTKIVNELAKTYSKTPTFIKAKNDKTKSKGPSATEAAATKLRQEKQQARMAKMRSAAGFKPTKLNKGGAAPSDTVPALLTPGEFVINAKSASKIGKANLNRMNKQGVQGFATGGVVQRFANGGAPYSTPQKFDAKGFPIDPKALSEVTKQASLQEKIMKKVNPLRERVAKTLQDMPNKFDNLKQGVQKASDKFKQSDGFKVAKENIDEGLKKVSNGLRDGEQKVKKGFGLVKGSVKQAASNVKSGLSQYRQSIQTGASQLKGSFNSVVSTINTKGESGFRRFFATIDRQTPTLQSAFSKVANGISGSIKRITGPLDRAAVETQKTAGKLSAASNTVRGPIANPAQGTAFASKNLSGMLERQGVSARRSRKAMAAFIGSINKGNSATKALAAGMKKGGVSLRSLEKAARKAAIADEKAAKAAERKTQADQKNAVAGGGKSKGKIDGMGAFFALQGLTAMLPRAEGATEGLGALQNKSIDLVMQFGTLAFAASSLGLKMNSTMGRFVAAGAAVYGLSQMIDAYTGVHEKAKKAIEEGNISKAGDTAVDSAKASDANKIAAGVGAIAGAGLGALGAIVGSAFGPIGTIIFGALGTAAGALVGVMAKVVASMEIFQPVLNFLRDNLFVLFGADSTAMVKEKAEADAAAAKASKELAENAKKASEALKAVESGDKSLQQAFDDGDLTGDITNRQRVLSERNDVLNRAKQERGVAQRKKQNLEDRFGDTSLTGNLKAAGVGALMGGGHGALLGSLYKTTGAILKSFGDNTKQAGEAVIEAEKKRIEAEKDIRDAQLKLLPQIILLGRSSFISGKSLEEFKNQTAKNLGVGEFSELDPEVRRKTLQAYGNNAIAIAENTAAFAASNMGLRPFRGFVEGVSVSLDRTSDILNGKFNSLGSSIDIVGAALSGAEVDSKVFNRSLNEINSNLSSFGVSSASISKINTSFNAVRTATGGFQDALEKTRDKVLSSETGESGRDIREELIKNLSELPGLGEEGKQIIKNIFGGIGDFTPDEIAQLEAGNFDAILKKLDEAGAKAFKEVNETGKALASAQNKLLSITQKRADAELKMIEAQKKSIDLQEEAAGILAEVGGKQLSSQEKLEFGRRRLSADLRGGAGSDGSVAGIMTRIGQIQSNAAGATSRLSGIAGGGEGDTFQAAEDQRSLTDSTRQLNSLAEFARKRVALYKKELEIVQKKNALEKSSLEKLISGDTLGFIEAQSAVAAQAALKSGNQALASMFSSKTLGAAFKDLEGQGLSDAEKRTAAATALGPGFASSRNVGVLTGTTNEEKGLRAGMREQAQILNAIAPAIQQLGSANFEVATAGLQYANDQFVSAQKKAAAASEKFAKTMAKAEEAAVDQAKRAKAQSDQAKAQADQAKTDEDKRRKSEKDLQEADSADVKVGKGGKVYVDGEEVKEFARGGAVYASRGMFIPRGTDTVPAMLTPGEFVVNRASVQRGNNLQVLQAMNGNSAAAAPAQGMSKGGPVYMDGGGTVPSTPDMTAMFKTFESSARMFNDAVTKLAGFKLNIQLDPTNVNVNLNGGTFLNQMKKELKDELLVIVSERIRGSSFDFTGDINMDPYTQNLS